MLHEPHPKSRPFGFAADRNSDFDFSSDTDPSVGIDSSCGNETAVNCIHCLVSHFGPCPHVSCNSIILNRVSTTGSVDSDIFTQSIPELESVSSSTDNNESSCQSSLNVQSKQKQELVQVMTEDRVRRLRDWTSYEQEVEEERSHFRRETME